MEPATWKEAQARSQGTGEDHLAQGWGGGKGEAQMLGAIPDAQLQHWLRGHALTDSQSHSEYITYV